MNKLHNSLIFILLALGLCGEARGNLNVSLTHPLDDVNDNEFYYFGYGSNMLAQRIHIQNPTAKRVGPALLYDYRLDFDKISSERWDGAVATIVPTPGSLTWGTLWKIDLSNLADIDDQEGVHLDLYKPVTVHVKLHGNETELETRAYLLTHQPESNLHKMDPDEVPESRQPSKTYLQVLVKGAIESGVPEDYVTWLKKVKHNNKTVEKLEMALQVHSVEL